MPFMIGIEQKVQAWLQPSLTLRKACGRSAAPVIARLVCRLFGHVWGPWRNTRYLRFRSCFRCGVIG